MKPIVRRIWSPVGDRPIAEQRPRYRWAYLFGFVKPSTGETFWLLMPTVSAEVWSIALAEFARHVGASEKKRIVLVIDGAGFHTAGAVRVPEGIHIEYLPAYSPELQPCERLWPLIREPLANRTFDDLPELEDTICVRCREVEGMRAYVQAITGFEWWLAAEAA